jgi:exodeoxyribonuclease V
MITPTPEQDRVLLEIKAWLDNPGPQFKYLAGNAGTGKTSLTKIIAEDRAVAFAAFSGKAAEVLRQKDCAGATTLHSLLYRPTEKQVADKWLTSFSLRENALEGIELVILDECSMVDAKLAQDLLSCGKRVLVLGDPFQLPPVSGAGYFTGRQPDWLLTQVHRQAKDSGILRLATDIREGRGFDPGGYGDDCTVIRLGEAAEYEDRLLDWTTMVIVGTHRWRTHFNRRYRERHDYFDHYPHESEQLVCLANDHKRGLLNGAIWIAETDARLSANGETYDLLIRSDTDSKLRLLVSAWAHDLDDRDAILKTLPHQKRKQHARFDYGYALTGHRAQGSQWDKVLVLDESSVFREHAANWLYSSVTRAAKQLIVVRQD